MQTLIPSLTPYEAIQKSRGWLILSGVLYFGTGLIAIIFPQFASLAIVQIISVILIITGVASLFAATFGKHGTHRIVHGLSAVLRIAVGILILKKVLAGLAVFTLILAGFFLVEGILGVIAAARLKWHGCWFWLLLNGIAGLVLGGIILAYYPITATWVIGLLYGVNAIFGGLALLILGFGGVTLPDSTKLETTKPSE